MSVEKAGQAYTWEEVFSFDRMKRAMTGRILDKVENICQGNQPISAEQISEIISEEWQRVKEAVRNSPAARESFRKYLERTVSERIDKLVEKDKAELESLGVVEKGI
jgi:hypothetical protein